MNDKKNDEKNLEFYQAKNLFETQVEKFLEKNTKKGMVELPSFRLESNEIKITFPVEKINPENLLASFDILFKHIDGRLRFQMFEPGYITLQDGGNILNPHKSTKEGIRFRFISILSKKEVEIEKTSDLTQNELQACLALFRFFYTSKKEEDPNIQLKNLGAIVYSTKKEEKTNGNFVPKEKQFHFSNANQSKIVGYKHVRREVLETIILPLKNPEIFEKVAQATRGKNSKNLAQAVLFEGPAGVGKTTMAKIIACETEIPMIYVPIENILSKYYGESAQNLAQVFDTAGQYEKCLIFLDEIDSLATSREQGLFEATRRLLSVLLRKIDGMESKPGILTIGASNRMNDLDNALVSRFDTIIHFPLPNINERAMIFREYAQHLENSHLKSLAHLSKDMSGRDIEDICEYTERSWTRHLITEKKDACAPSYQFYIRVAKNMQEKHISIKSRQTRPI